MIYWLTLASIIIFQLIKRKENIFYLNLAFYIFIIGAILKIIVLSNFSEFFMRISFIFFLVGLILSLFQKEK